MAKGSVTKRASGRKPTQRAARKRPLTAKAAPIPSYSLRGKWLLTYNRILRAPRGGEATLLDDGGWGAGDPDDALYKWRCTFTATGVHEFEATPSEVTAAYPGRPPGSLGTLGTLKARIATRRAPLISGGPAVTFSVLTMIQESPTYLSAWAGSQVYPEKAEFRGFWRDCKAPEEMHAGYFKLTKIS